MKEPTEDLLLNGDLCQMASQRKFLRQRGFQLGQVDVYPTVAKEDVIQALRSIWLSKTEGWWNYRVEYLKYGISALTKNIKMDS